MRTTTSTHHDCSLPAVIRVKLDHVLEGEVADDVAVQDKERIGVALSQHVLRQSQRAGCNPRQHMHFATE